MKRALTSAPYRLVVTGLLLWAIAATAYGTLRLTFGPRPVYVHVRWAPSIDDTARPRLEERYGLTRAELREGRTWGYTLINLSRDNIRALVGDAAVEDTHLIHRTAFRVGYFAPRRPYPTPYPRIPAGLEILSLLCLLVGVAAFGVRLLETMAPAMILGPIRVLRNTLIDPRGTLDGGARLLVVWLRARIPGASPEAVALFRIVFGIALLAVVLGRPVRGEWAAQPENVISDAQRLAVRVFTEAPWLADWIAPWLAFWGSLFIVGAMARSAFAMLAIGVFAWALLYTTGTTYHTVSALLVTLVCLFWSRWGDAWSIDAWRRQRRADPEGPARRTPQEYGYTVWAPSFVLGVAFAAAAFAKLRDSGLAWILNGTVKYHFLSDSKQAWVDWGLDLAPYHWIAVLLSFGAIAIESLVIAGVFSRVYLYRLMAGASALCLLGGFALLQGLFWPGWWILLLSFLPWHLVTPAVAEAPATDATGRGPGPREPVQGTDQSAPVSWRRLLQPAPVVVVIALIGLQTVVSWLRLEVSPLISTYDMYSTTYGSPAEYEQKAGQTYWIMATDDNAEMHECRIARVDADVIATAAERPENRGPTAELLRHCFEPSVRLRSVSMEARRGGIDWTRWRQEEPERVPLMGPIPAAVILRAP